MPRGNFGYLTAIGNAIIFAVNEIESNGFDGLEKKIDVAGDGRNNAGHNPVTAGALALARGITINGLAIGDPDPGPVEYAQNVISGPTPSSSLPPLCGFCQSLPPQAETGTFAKLAMPDNGGTRQGLP
ncbi:MAG: DUF1194 domain-containing protein [Rhodospirillaceae bacterium]|nr:DUF1194 domain-containing protein [Rhodospirillaceae bacterium]